MELPTVTECNNIPDDRSEIPTPDVISHQTHLICSRAQILLLIGQDQPEAHHVGGQRIGTRKCTLCSTSEPGLVVVGEVFLGNFHKPTTVASLNTKLIDLHRETISKPCSNVFQLKKRHFKVLIKKPMYIIFKRMIMRLDSPQTIESLWI